MMIIVPGWTSDQSCCPLIAITASLPSIARSYISSSIYLRWSRASRVSFLKRSLIASANICYVKGTEADWCLLYYLEHTSYDPANPIGISCLFPVASIRTTPVNVGRRDVAAKWTICCCSIKIGIYMAVKAWFPSAHVVHPKLQNCSPKTFASSIQYLSSIVWSSAWR